MQAQLEGRDHAEVAATAAQRPVQVRVLVGARADTAAVGEDDLGGDEVVDGHPVAPALVGDAAAERQAGHAGLGHDPAGSGEPERRGDAIDVGPRGAALHVHGSIGGVDADAAHRREVDDEAVVDEGGACDVVAAAADGERQLVLGGEADGGRDVVGVGAARDRGRALVDHAVPHAAGGVVLDVIGRDDLAGQALGERGGEMGGGGGIDGHGGAPPDGDARSLRPGRPATVPAGVRDPSRVRPTAG